MAKIGSGTAKKILDAANAAYPDEQLQEYYDSKGKFVKGTGDSLAQYIVIEIADSVGDTNAKASEADAIELAIQRLQTGQTELAEVVAALYELRRKVE